MRYLSIYLSISVYISMWLPRWWSAKESACQYRKCKRHGFNSWVRKIPWSRKWQPMPVFLPGEFHRQDCLLQPVRSQSIGYN